MGLSKDTWKIHFTQLLMSAVTTPSPELSKPIISAVDMPTKYFFYPCARAAEVQFIKL